MSADLLTVAMATYEDFHGVWMTVQALRSYHPRVRLLVLDNAPRRCNRTTQVTLACQGTYLHRPDLTGTSASRDSLFHFAETPWVLVCDSHILFEAGAIQALLNYIDSHPMSNDLIQGPLLYDDGHLINTHWRQDAPPGLWGVWERMWRDQNGVTTDVSPGGQGEVVFSNKDDVLRGSWGTLPTPQGTIAPPRWENHQEVLAKAGWKYADEGTEPFEIPMQGLGVFAMRKEAWPGFNPFFQGFGGEEGYIHEKVRQQGGRCLCLPNLRWKHLFRDESPTPYPIQGEDQVWNLLVGHRELGIEATEEIWQVFGSRVRGGRAQFDRMKAEAEKWQPWKVLTRKPAKQKILGIWYSNNAAPLPLLQRSLATIQQAAQGSRHEVLVTTCSYDQVQGNPFTWVLAVERLNNHLGILKQQRQCVGAAGSFAFDAVVFLEHDVLYPADYFDRMGDALARNPKAPVISNLDYEGLNETGWLQVKERHEPMHQLCIRRGVFEENWKRAVADCERQGWAYLEPDSTVEGTTVTSDRSSWVRLPFAGRMPSIHVNHEKRFTSHGEVCYFPTSNGRLEHPYWGHFTLHWPYPVKPPVQNEGGCGVCGKSSSSEAPQAPVQTIEDLYNRLLVVSTDINEHMPVLKHLASKVDHVTEVSTWVNGALSALAMGKPKRLVSIVPGHKPDWDVIQKEMGDAFLSVIGDPREKELPEETDLLFVDTFHAADFTYRELVRFAPKVRKRIVYHDSVVYGENGDGPSCVALSGNNLCPGIMPAIRRYMREHPEWSVVKHYRNNNGLIVLSRDPEDKKKLPGLIQMAWNYSKAKVAHLAGGSKTLPLEMVEERLNICATCESRTGNRCGECGCPLDVTDDGREGKTLWAEQECPLGHWRAVELKEKK